MKKPSNSWGIVQDERGRILGRMYARSPMLESDVQIVKKFLCEIQKGKLMANQNNVKDKCNIVYLAGKIKTLKVRDDGGAFMLIDPVDDDKSKYLPCTIHDNKQLTAVLELFRVDDTIQVQGYLRAWSQKKGEEWRNHVEVRVTRIATVPPSGRERQRERASASSMQQDDDAVPF